MHIASLLNLPTLEVVTQFENLKVTRWRDRLPINACGGLRLHALIRSASLFACMGKFGCRSRYDYFVDSSFFFRHTGS